MRTFYILCVMTTSISLASAADKQKTLQNAIAEITEQFETPPRSTIPATGLGFVVLKRVEASNNLAGLAISQVAAATGPMLTQSTNNAHSDAKQEISIAVPRVIGFDAPGVQPTKEKSPLVDPQCLLRLCGKESSR